MYSIKASTKTASDVCTTTISMAAATGRRFVINSLNSFEKFSNLADCGLPWTIHGGVNAKPML
jgi:hypothetical protein